MTPTAHFALKPYNTFGIDAHADWGLPVTRLDTLRRLLQDPAWASLPRLVLGGGSNVLFTCDFHGLVLINQLRGIERSDSEDAWLLRVGAGENWHELVCWTLEQGMPGLENLALIPGSVGAAPVQNIGAYGVELCDFCDYVEVYQISTDRLLRLSAQECAFGYRDSRFKHDLKQDHIITTVGLRLPKRWQAVREYGPLRSLPAEADAKLIFDTICRQRREKLPEPEQLGNAGSFFKNPTVPRAQADALSADFPAMPRFAAGEDQVKLAAGWLIDQAGLKGYRLGQAAVHTEQALVLVNLGGATAAELVRLAREVRQRVLARFGIQLEPEVRFIGAEGETHLDEVVL